MSAWKAEGLAQLITAMCQMSAFIALVVATGGMLAFVFVRRREAIEKTEGLKGMAVIGACIALSVLCVLMGCALTNFNKGLPKYVDPGWFEAHGELKK